jgi:hypothetical protein
MPAQRRKTPSRDAPEARKQIANASANTKTPKHQNTKTPNRDARSAITKRGRQRKGAKTPDLATPAPRGHIPEGFPPYPAPQANLYDDPMTWQIH